MQRQVPPAAEKVARPKSGGGGLGGGGGGGEGVATGKTSALLEVSRRGNPHLRHGEGKGGEKKRRNGGKKASASAPVFRGEELGEEKRRVRHSLFRSVGRGVRRCVATAEGRKKVLAGRLNNLLREGSHGKKPHCCSGKIGGKKRRSFGRERGGLSIEGKMRVAPPK